MSGAQSSAQKSVLNDSGSKKPPIGTTNTTKLAGAGGAKKNVTNPFGLKKKESSDKAGSNKNLSGDEAISEEIVVD